MITHTPVRGLLFAVLAVVFVLPSIAETSLAAPAKTKRVLHGKRVAIAGHVEPRAAGRTVVLERASRGRAYRAIDEVTTGRDGAYRFVVRARRTASYRAVVQPPVALAATTAPSVSRTRRIVVVARIAARATRHLIAGGRVKVRGGMRPALRGRKVRVQLRTRHGWKTVDRTRTGRGGRFKAAWRPSTVGRYRLRVRFAGDGAAAANSDRLPRVHVYRGAHASWYGPGLYGNSTACGGALTPWRLGVAHKSLPCGTRVTFRYRGRSVTVPVIDRGPYAAGREWDLTAATKAKLGFPDTGTVWSTR